MRQSRWNNPCPAFLHCWPGASYQIYSVSRALLTVVVLTCKVCFLSFLTDSSLLLILRWMRKSSSLGYTPLLAVLMMDLSDICFVPETWSCDAPEAVKTLTSLLRLYKGPTWVVIDWLVVVVFLFCFCTTSAATIPMVLSFVRQIKVLQCKLSIPKYDCTDYLW